MTRFLLGDIGGTNSRFALTKGGSVDATSIVHFQNDDFPDFSSALSGYLKGQPARDISACCMALAGPVSGNVGVLTNRPWQIETVEIKRQTGCGKVSLINDLYALGRGVASLQPDQLTTLVSAPPPIKSDGQGLVVNIGTGFNIAFLLTNRHGVLCSSSEAGHSSLPSSVAKLLESLVGNQAMVNFPTIEHCFSGSGLTEVFTAATGQPRQSSKAIIAQAALCPPHHSFYKTMQTYAQMLGVLLHELTLLCPADRGIFFAGSVARGVLESVFGLEMQNTFTESRLRSLPMPDSQISLITTEFAGLLGCLSVLEELAALTVDTISQH